MYCFWRNRFHVQCVIIWVYHILNKIILKNFAKKCLKLTELLFLVNNVAPWPKKHIV